MLKTPHRCGTGRAGQEPYTSACVDQSEKNNYDVDGFDRIVVDGGINTSRRGIGFLEGRGVEGLMVGVPALEKVG